ncbi:MAG: porin [Pseudomonadota bacterium]
MTKIPRSTTLASALCSAGVLLLSGQVAHANDDFKFKGGGFGTLGAAVTDLDGTQFRTGLDQYSGADKHVDLGVDSRLGLQGTVMYKSDFSVTAQLLGTRRQDVDFDLGVEWLYAQYTGISGLDLKAGRVALPAFLVSDSRFVAYTSPWLRVPTLVYSMMPISTVDGYQAGYRHTIGPAVASLQVTHGRTKAKLSTVQDVGFTLPTYLDGTYSKVTSVNALLEWGDWTARIGQVKSDVDFKTAVDIPGSGMTPGTSLALSDTFTGAGLQYDNGQALVVAEYVTRKTVPSPIDGKAWYVGGGYRFGPVMPYVLISKYTPSEGKDSKGAAVGVRYDFAKDVALKVEYARYDTNDFYSVTDNVTPAVVDKKLNVLSVSIDFVF